MPCARQAGLDAAATPACDGSTFQSQQRGTHLFAKLLKCGDCGGGFSKIATHLGCSNARNKGDAVCNNRRTIKRTDLEAAVLDALRTRLMAPDLYASFVRGFTAEWNKEQGARHRPGRQARRARAHREEDHNFVDAIAETGSSAALLSGLKQAEARKVGIEAGLAVAEAPAPRLMPNLAELYRVKVSALQEALGAEDAGAAREQVRTLIDEIRLIPCPKDPKAPLRIEVRGHLAAMLALGSGTDASASEQLARRRVSWLRGQDLNLRPSGYEPDELPGCSTPRRACRMFPTSGRKTLVGCCRQAKERGFARARSG